ncbi:MAG: hypothetical protein WCW17_03490 [Patescibacteria group bacterium]|jgi:hypothetical protein
MDDQKHKKILIMFKKILIFSLTYLFVVCGSLWIYYNSSGYLAAVLPHVSPGKENAAFSPNSVAGFPSKTAEHIPNYVWALTVIFSLAIIVGGIYYFKHYRKHLKLK